MKLSERLFKEVEPIWNSYYEHPFVKELGDGSLPIEKFRFYMVQDYIYLLDYARVFALGVVTSKDEKYMRKFSEFEYGILNTEMSVHKHYCKELGITEQEISSAKASLANISYTNYMLWVGQNQGSLELLTTILACSWSYELIGKELAKRYPQEGNPYAKWIEGYASKEYEALSQDIINMLDEMGQNCSEELFENLKDIFVNCSRYEYLFWDMSYDMSM